MKGDIMWLILGIGAVAFALSTVIWTVQGKDARWFSYISLSLTALTLCAFYSGEAKRVVSEDWVGLMDIMPTMSKTLWVYTVVSILINSVALLKNNK